MIFHGQMHPLNPQTAGEDVRSIDGGQKEKCTHFDYPCRSLLLTTKHPLSANDASLRIDCSIDDIDRLNMCAMGVGVFMPHPDNYV